jgi:hypothetical protein
MLPLMASLTDIRRAPRGVPSVVSSLCRCLPVAALVLLLAACAGEPRRPATSPSLTPAEARALIARTLPAGVTDRTGWATDLYAAFATLGLDATPPALCAAMAVVEQESSFRVNPTVPGLSRIAWREIDAKAEAAGIPRMLVHAALRIDSSDGRSYAERIDTATTELELSRIFEDILDRVPMGRRLFGRWNPVRTGGPMQVGIAFAESYVRDKPYPYPMAGTVRDEVFTRRGGLYFGIAHLLAYPADYDAYIYRYADFNAGHHASRNAAFQQAVSLASGVPLALDGDLIAHDAAADKPGSTELAVRTLGERVGMSDSAIRRALEEGSGPSFGRSALYRRVFELAEAAARKPLPRAIVPRIALKSPKITRDLTTEWFARRVDERQQRCLTRAAGDGVAREPAPLDARTAP